MNGRYSVDLAFVIDIYSNAMDTSPLFTFQYLLNV